MFRGRSKMEYSVVLSFFIVFALHEGVFCDPAVITTPSVTLTEGSRASLPCRVVPQSLLWVQWKKAGVTDVNLLIHLKKSQNEKDDEKFGPGYNNGHVDMDESYSLIISNVTKSDEGIYYCEILEAVTSDFFVNHTYVTITDKPYLYIKGCGHQTNCNMAVPRDEDYILLHCSIIGAMGKVFLYWTRNKSKDDILGHTAGQSDVPSNYSLALRQDKEDIQNRLSFTCIAQATQEYDTMRSSVILYSDPNSGHPFTTSSSHTYSQANKTGPWVASTLSLVVVIIVLAIVIYRIRHVKDSKKQLLGNGNSEEMQNMIEQDIKHYPTPHMNEPFSKHASGRYIKPRQSAAKSTHPQSMKYDDDIRGTIIMPPYCQVIINTPEFQRLRYIKQLSCTSYTYPTAVHTRFQHSIGVSYLAGKYINHLQRDASNNISAEDVACVQIAGLCHDLGQLPLSHELERLVSENPTRIKRKRVDASVEIFKHLIKKNKLETDLQMFGLDDRHIDFICDLILGGSDHPIPGKWFLYQIVNNRANAVDVDKWDYIIRDSFFLGRLHCDIDQIFESTKVLEVQQKSGSTRKEICFKEEVKDTINDMFWNRRNLNTCVYRHRATSVFSIMIYDALREVTGELKYTGDNGEISLLEAVEDPSTFCKLTDWILLDIMRSGSNDDGMKKAQGIIDRIQNGQLYQFIVEVDTTSEPNTLDTGEILERIEKNMPDFCKKFKDEINLEITSLENIALEVCEFDLGHGEKNPFSVILFLEEKGSEGSKKISTDEMPSDFPQRFRSVTVRIFSRVPAEEYRITEKDRAMFNELLTDAVNGKNHIVEHAPEESRSTVNIEKDDQETPETKNLISKSEQRPSMKKK